MTTNWFSLRLHDDSNTTRRTIHPLWQEFQNCKFNFGKVIDASRDLSHDTAGATFYLSRAANNLLGYAAVMGLDNFDYALAAFSYELSQYWEDKNYPSAFKTKNIKVNGQKPGEV